MVVRMSTAVHPISGAGTLFALRAVGCVLLVRLLFAMSLAGYGASLTVIASSPWACINIALIFLLLVLPGAYPRAEFPFHPLPSWLRQALRCFALLGLAFTVWTISAFAWLASWRGVWQAVITTNGWLMTVPVLYVFVIWLCRPRPLWPTNLAAGRFAIGCYAVSRSSAARIVTVWAGSRKLGQYNASELSVRLLPRVVETATMTSGGIAAPRRWLSRPKAELLWNSPAAAGHNGQRVFRVRLTTRRDRDAARSLEAALKGS